MNYKSTYILLAALLFSTSGLLAQERLLKEADKLYNNLAYVRAIETYHQVLELEEENVEAKVRLANCYRLINDTENAASWYEQFIDLGVVKPEDHLNFGQVLMSNGIHKEARKQFLKYAELKPNDSRGKVLAAACANQTILKTKSKRYKVKEWEGNTSQSEIAPFMIDGGFIFTAEKDQVGVKNLFGWNGSSFYDLYISRLNSNGWDSPKKLKGNVNSGFHDGPASMTADGNTMVFSRNSETYGNSGLRKINVYIADKDGDRWENVRKLPFNTDDRIITHPAISHDGTYIIFVSDKPGGHGGSDLYISTKRANGWSSPVNLGKTVNTPGNEVFPFIHADETLYFSSDGHNKMGGLDILYSRNYDGKWDEPINLGFPINSEKDDFGWVLDGLYEKGMFSSNRGDDFKDDNIYIVDVLNSKELKAPKGNYEVIGHVQVGKRNKKGISVMLFSNDGSLLETTESDDKGLFIFSKLASNDQYMIGFNGDNTSLEAIMVLRDGNGKVIKWAKKEKDGNFRFQKLPSAYNEISLMDAEDPGFMSEPGMLKISGKIVSSDNRVEGKKGLKVNLLDETGNIIETTITASDGSFQFERLPSSGKYLVDIEGGHTDIYTEMIMVDDRGETVRTAVGTGAAFAFEKLPTLSKMMS
ncbi:MAG: PD40 domain-containing protein, partial [Bacteroidetes bacterium]|nr:PD40 domain-containing protein [Bacteroidota bacterium]